MKTLLKDNLVVSGFFCSQVNMALLIPRCYMTVFFVVVFLPYIYNYSNGRHFYSDLQVRNNTI